MMDANDKSVPGNAQVVSPAERRSGSERRLAGRRKADRKSACVALPDSGSQEPARPPSANPEAAGSGPVTVRKYYFRSFEDRRQGVDRRTPAQADDPQMTANDADRPLPSQEE